jgi:hypothetical protein
MRSIAYALISVATLVMCALVALLLSDATAPGRLPPMLGFWGATLAGFGLVAGLALLEPRRSATS